MDINIFVSDQVRYKATEYLTSLFSKHNEENILFLSSGGSALKLLEGLEIKSDPQSLTLSVLDERFNTDPRINNFLQFTSTTFCQNLNKLGANFISTVPDEGESLKGLANKVERELKKWKELNPNGKVIITQGIGPDGHTSGIMPYPENPKLFKHLFGSQKWVIGYDAGEKNQYPQRVTTTMTFLRDVVDYSLVYMVGEDKKKILKKLILKQDSLASMPAMVVWEMKDVKLFTDQK